ncbi:MAG: VIT1/CCC1 transporter family protein [Bacteroidales bacterium]|nr:VIT1/CCC1 transporter family protein [Bacteroidales bacterium]
MDIQKKNALLKFQKEELTMSLLYKRLASICKDEKNKNILVDLSNEELKHYKNVMALTDTEVSSYKTREFVFYLISRIFGITFGIKLLECGEKRIIEIGKEKIEEVEIDNKNLLEVEKSKEDIIRKRMVDGEKYEAVLINMIDEKRLSYMNAVVLGLNDAIIEFTGALAGFAFAFSNHKVTAMAGAITGIAASLSMGASEYMSERTINSVKNSLAAATYTFITYLFTVTLLLFPFIFISNNVASLVLSLISGTLVVAFFNFYYAISKSVPFWKRFLEMIGISMSVAAVSFTIGLLLKHFSGINI